MNSRLLIVDDDCELVELLSDYLNGEGFSVTAAHDGASGVTAALSGQHDLVVLDVMMPGMNGIEALRCIRAASQVPVLMLTARGDESDRVVGLELGADDYVPKPCSPRELTARVRAILKRSAPGSTPGITLTTDKLQVGGLVLWPTRRMAELNDAPLALTSTEFSVLEVLAKNAGQTVSKEDLSRTALGRPLTRFDRSIDVHISSVRQKLGPLPDGRSPIQTVIRRGYQMVAE
jgi:DNA-binding response OmpR family regulator